MISAEGEALDAGDGLPATTFSDPRDGSGIDQQADTTVMVQVIKQKIVRFINLVPREQGRQQLTGPPRYVS